jgi:hypothetical protein
MKERIIENWLDNASERSYQPIFCQYLLKAGYQLIHSTRHTASEHGKDILAIDADGTPCAFQLKGNPKGRITLDYYRKELLPQLSALTDQAIQNPAIDRKIPHKSYFVTNGRIDEDVSIAIDQRNEKNMQDGIGQRNLHVIARDQLLSKILSLGNEFWPSEINETKLLLEIITMRGNEMFPIKKYHYLLIDLLRLRDEDQKPSSRDIRRRVSGAMVLTSLCLGPFSSFENHWAIICAWTQTAVYLISLLQRWNLAKREITLTVDMIELFIAESLMGLMREVFNRNKKQLSEGDLSTDHLVYPWRYTLLVSILSVAKLSEYKLAHKDDEIHDQLRLFLKDREMALSIDGEFAVPGVVHHIWALRDIGENTASRDLSIQLTRLTLSGLIPVYYTCEEILEDSLAMMFQGFKLTLKDIGSEGSSWVARQAFMSMVHLDLFDECAELWKPYSLAKLKEFRAKESWQYCLIYSRAGKNEFHTQHHVGDWKALKKMADDDPISDIPTVLANRPTLLRLWTLIAPHRFTLSALNVLSRHAKSVGG